MSLLQTQLFDPGPADPVAEWYHGSRNRWDSSRQTPAHVGTRTAAEDRLFTRSRDAVAGVRELHQFRIRGEMANTPDRPVSDRLANELFEGEGAYDGDYGPVYDDSFDWDSVFSDVDRTSPDKGVYYRNAYEDPGSISAIVADSGRDLERVASYRTKYTPLRQQEFGEFTQWEGGLDIPAVRQPRLFDVNDVARDDSEKVRGRSKVVSAPEWERYA